MGCLFSGHHIVKQFGFGLKNVNFYHYFFSFSYLFAWNILRDDAGRRPMPVSLLLSSQVTNITSNISGDPVEIQFEYSTVSTCIVECYFIV